jgi:hypothetical protein
MATAVLAMVALLASVEMSANALSRQPKGRGAQQAAVLLTTGSGGSASVVTVTTTIPVPTSIQVSGNCGTLLLASGWPTTTMPGPQATSCIYTALRTGRSATLTEVAETDGLGGHPRVTTFRVTSRNRLLVTIDNRKAKPSGTVQKWRCTGLASRADEFVATGCKKT